MSDNFDFDFNQEYSDGDDDFVFDLGNIHIPIPEPPLYVLNQNQSTDRKRNVDMQDMEWINLVGQFRHRKRQIQGQKQDQHHQLSEAYRQCPICQKSICSASPDDYNTPTVV